MYKLEFLHTVFIKVGIVFTETDNEKDKTEN